jgi:hypothetical protein
MTWVLFVEVSQGDVLSIGPLTAGQCGALLQSFLSSVRAVCLPWTG